MGGCAGKLPCCGGSEELPPKLRPPSLCGVILGLIIPYCFIVIAVSFYLSPACIIACISVMCFFVIMATSAGTAWERNYPSTLLLGPIFAVSMMAAFVIGVKIYVKIYAPYYLAISAREYSNVAATARTMEYADAGIIEFAPDASLDTSRSFGLKASDFTYCVAPVVSRDADVHPHSSGPKISFWAVGRDCCSNRQNFECDGASETEVRSAFTVRDFGNDPMMKFLVPNQHRPLFLKAVEAAKALHNLQSEDPDEVVLLRWAAAPKKTLKVWYNRALLACTLACTIYSLVITALWSSVHVSFDKKVRAMLAAAEGGKP